MTFKTDVVACLTPGFITPALKGQVEEISFGRYCLLFFLPLHHFISFNFVDIKVENLFLWILRERSEMFPESTMQLSKKLCWRFHHFRDLSNFGTICSKLFCILLIAAPLQNRSGGWNLQDFSHSIGASEHSLSGTVSYYSGRPRMRRRFHF